MITIDTRGQTCPAPIIAAKKALREAGEGEQFNILTDNSVSFNNLIRFLNDNKAEVNTVEANGIWTLTVLKGRKLSQEIEADTYCKPEIAHFEKGNFIIVISSDLIGEGDNDLGSLLMGNFIKAVKDLDKLPEKMIFYNKGVTLATSDSPHSEHLLQLEKMGVEIILCTTCVNHYAIGEKLAVGILGNMFTIAGMMVNADKVIKP